MTEENPSNFDAQAEYLNESSLLEVREFTTTMKQGYIEEEVDIWREEAYAHVRDLVNKYNSLAYRAGLAVEAANTRAEEAESRVKALEAELEAVRNAPVETPAYVAEEETSEAEVDYDNYDVEDEPAVDEPVFEEETYVAAEEEPEVEPVAEPVAPVSPVIHASERAQQILTAAAEEATEHVSRALDRVAKVEAEAQAEAQELVSTATVEAAEILANATDEAESIKATAITDAAEALNTLDNAKAETRALFERVALFHQASLEQSQALLGTVTPEEPAGEVELNEEAPEVEFSDEVNDYETDFLASEDDDSEVELDTVEDEEPVETDFAEDDLADLDGELAAQDAFDEEVSEEVADEPAEEETEDVSYEVELDADGENYSYDTEVADTLREESDSFAVGEVRPAEAHALNETAEETNVESFEIGTEDDDDKDGANYRY